MKVTKACCCFIILFAGLISACSSVDGFNQARRVAKNFFEDRFENGGAGSDEFYSKVFWENTDVSQWRDIQKVVDLSLGGAAVLYARFLAYAGSIAHRSTFRHLCRPGF